jgi:hypothetical protein
MRRRQGRPEARAVLDGARREKLDLRRKNVIAIPEGIKEAERMRKFGTLAAIILCVAAIVSTACTSNDGAGSGRNTADAANANQTATTAAPSPAGDGIQRITVAEARKAVDGGSAVFVDVRSPLEFERGHIKGSLSLPKGQIAQRAGELPKDKLIITYCA